MASPLTLVGIEVPRTPQMLGASVRSGGEWAAGRHSLLRRWVEIALELTSAENVRLITGLPDQEVFDVLEQYGLVDVMLSDWIGILGERGRVATPSDVVVIMRGFAAIDSPITIRRAIDTLRATASIDSVEPAIRPRQQAFDELVVIDADSGTPRRSWADALGVPPGTLDGMGVSVPVFEVRRLKSFASGISRFGIGSTGAGGGAKGLGVVWMEEHEVAVVEGPLGLLRAEWVCERYPIVATR